ncbi:MAG: hypothetical protein PHP86_09115 [Nevskiales bacterium]|nr:hypothetical protein [Nevskiales bacterium]
MIGAIDPRMLGRAGVWTLAAWMLVACQRETPAPPQPLAAPPADAPGRDLAAFVNPEPTVLPQCYTRTDGVANSCWACHTTRNGRNEKGDWTLQETYAFSPAAMDNHWRNVFVDRSAAIAAISDAEIQAYIDQDNYRPLYSAARQQRDATAYTPDLDYAQGFDAQGYARDGSGWRAFRYKPLPGGGFWPTNGASDDLLIRLPAPFRQDAAGRPSRAIYSANLAILEAAMTVADTVPDDRIRRRVEPLDEAAAGVDLDGDGRLAVADHIRGLPSHYVGAAAAQPVHRWRYPLGTEFLHSVRYVDVDRPGMLSARLKELRYSVKRIDADDVEVRGAYRSERDEKASGLVPRFRGDARTGLRNAFGWVYQGWIEDADGALRPQTLEEHYNCMGCHGGIGITADSSFGFPRKQPGAEGWGWQRLAGMPDVPMAGHREPEILTWLRRARGGDAYRSNDEILQRFFPEGVYDEAAVRRAAPGGDRDLRWLIAPSRARATALNKAYLALVRAQDFAYGRDVFLRPPENVHRHIDNGDTGLRAQNRVYSDGRIWLDWDPD